MSYKVRKTTDSIVYAMVAEHNEKQVGAVASLFHADITSTTSLSAGYTAPVRSTLLVAVADATTEATAVALTNQLKAYYNIHVADTLAHDSAVSAALATADATDEASAITLANAWKAAYNTHLSAANVHFTNDGTNTVTSVDATDTASLYTLANECKVDYNAHIISAPNGSMIELTPA